MNGSMAFRECTSAAGQQVLTSGAQTLLVDLVLLDYRAGQWVRALDRVTDWTPGRMSEVTELEDHALLESQHRGGTLIYRLTPEGCRTADQMIIEFYANTHPDLAAAAARRLADNSELVSGSTREGLR